MKNPTVDKKQTKTLTASKYLQAVPVANEAMRVTRMRDGEALAEIPLNRPRWLVPPISWILPFSSRRRVRLDSVGAGVLNRCDGKNTIEKIIEDFAAENKLSFREAQLPVTQFLQQMTQRGMVVLVSSEAKA